MDILKSKDPVDTAKRNCYALGGFGIFVSLLLFAMVSTQYGAFFSIVAIVTVILSSVWILAGKLLSKRNKAGVYLSWTLVILSTVGMFAGWDASVANLVSLVLIIYMGYWTYQAQQVIDNVKQEGTTQK